MIKKIACYITDVSKDYKIRCGVILDTLLKLEEELEVHIKGGRPVIEYLMGYLKSDERIFYYEEETDVAPAGFLAGEKMDRSILNEEMELYVESWDERIEKEKEFLIKKEIGLVLTDLCPWILLAADDLRIKSLLITDCTWDLMFEDRISEDLCDAFRECYEAASKVYLYEVHHPEMETVFREYEKLSLILRPHNLEKIEALRRNDKPLIYLDVDREPLFSVGGLPYHFFVTSDRYPEADHVTRIEGMQADTQNEIAASDYVITEGSWNTLSEALLTNKKIAVLPREFSEKERAAAFLLKERGQCIIIEEKEEIEIEEIISRLQNFEYSYETEYHNDDYEAAKRILMEYPKRRRRKRT